MNQELSLHLIPIFQDYGRLVKLFLLVSGGCGTEILLRGSCKKTQKDFKMYPVEGTGQQIPKLSNDNYHSWKFDMKQNMNI